MEILYLCFNKEIATEAQSKGLPAATSHSKYFADYKNYVGKVKVNSAKVYNIVTEIINTDDTYTPNDSWMIAPVIKLVGVNGICLASNIFCRSAIASKLAPRNE